MLTLLVLLIPFPMADALAAEGRPRIGLALSGGGARGAAHVGVIKVLEELRIPIDYIAGTSMGAIVGGLYASGMSAEELEHTLGTLDWDDVFSDLPPRPERSMRRKTDDRVYMTRLEAGVKGTEVGIKPALILGQKFNLVLRKLTLPVAGEQDFDRLRIPFRCVATNIENGQPVILESGDLARAMVASMAVPAAFGTVEWNGLLLVDGGMANNLPVSVVRAMGADIVIAVDISAPTLSREKLRNPLAVVDQLTTLMTRRVTDQEIASLAPRDLLIVPPLKDIGSMDFKRAQEAIATGETAARGMRERLAALSLSRPAYGAYLAQRQAPPKNLPRVAFVRFKNDSRVSDQVLAENLGLTPGAPLDVPALEKGLARIYGLEVFESVRYQILEEDGQTGVLVEARERSWGTNTLQAGMELATGLNGGSAFSIGAAYTLRPLNAFNGEWRTLGSLGEEQGLATEIYQPLTPDDDYFLRGTLAYRGQTTRIYEGNQPRAEYEVRRYGIELAGGRNLDRWGRLEVGLRRYAGDTEVVVGEESDVVTDGDFNDGQAYLRLGVDTLDSFFFPRTGHYGVLTWTASRGALGADTDYDQLEARWLLSRSWGKHTLLGSLSLGTTLDDAAPPQNLFQIGGFLNLSGLSQNQFAGQHLGFGYLGYLYRWNDTLVPIYLGFSLEAGNVWQDSGDFGSDLIQAGSLFAGADTPLGPLYVGYGRGSLGESAFYLFLGQPWL